ncbi:MAG: ISL3 family transposase [Phycisphaeraceae bacterium]
MAWFTTSHYHTEIEPIYVEGFRELYRFPGYAVKAARIDEAIGEVTLRRDGRFKLACPHCESRITRSREVPQMVRDLGLGPLPLVLIRYPAIQGWCRSCRRYATVRPPGIGERQQATDRLMAFASHLCRFMPVTHVADALAVTDKAVREWDKRILRQTIGEPNLDNLEVLLIDEKSIGKHQPVVLNGVSGELLHMHQGTKPEGIESFFEKLTDKQKASIHAVGIDRDGAYEKAVKAHLSADVVYDKFHVIANYNRVIDDVRRSEWQKAKAQDKPVLKGMRYILFKRAARRSDEDEDRLNALLAVNENLLTVDMLKDDLHQLWACRNQRDAEAWLADWIDWALTTTIGPLRRFARGLRRSTHGILNYFKHRITNGPIEAFNNLISRTIHRACGVRDREYLYLKLRQESLA